MVIINIINIIRLTIREERKKDEHYKKEVAQREEKQFHL